MSNTIESVEDDAGNVITYRRHANGGGLIGRGAKADDTSFISSTTYVEAGACVGSGCRIGAGSWIDHRARIGNDVVIGDAVYVGQGATVGNSVHIGSHSRIGARAQIDDGVHLHGDTTVTEGGVIGAGSRPTAGSSVTALRRHKLPRHKEPKRTAA